MNNKEFIDNIQDDKKTVQSLINSRKYFVSYNVLRLRELFRNLSEKKKELFNIIPFFLHVNSPDYPGYVNSKKIPFGIISFYDSGFFKFSLKYFKITAKQVRPFTAGKFYIRGLYIMGSSGTLAQGEHSDFDYWVVLDKSACTESQLVLLEEKFAKIELWCKKEYNQSVSFFIMDVNEIKSNNFSRISEESSGSAQKTILKEEFYRTFIVIAGLIPLWAVLPVGINNYQYKYIVKKFLNTDNSYDLYKKFIDLGNLNGIDKKECACALLWQIYKSRSDPVKALLKSSLIASYYCGLNKLLPCDIIKKSFLNDNFNTGYIDPYVVIFNYVIKFYNKIYKQGLPVIEEAIFFRLCGFPVIKKTNPEHPKGILVKKLLTVWKWDSKKICYFTDYVKWTEQKKLSHEKKILKQIRVLYKMVLGKNIDKEQLFYMDDLELVSLKNRISAILKKEQGKIPRCSRYLQLRGQQPLSVFGSDELWYVYDNRERKLRNKDLAIFKDKELLRVIGWIIYNALCLNDLSLVKFQSLKSEITSGKAGRLLSIANDFFSDKKKVEKYYTESVWEKIFVSVKTESFYKKEKFTSAEIILKNSWGEYFFLITDLADIEIFELKCYKIANVIWKYFQTTPDFNIKYFVYTYDSWDSDLVVKKIDELITNFINKARKECDNNIYLDID